MVSQAVRASPWRARILGLCLAVAHGTSAAESIAGSLPRWASLSRTLRQSKSTCYRGAAPSAFYTAADRLGSGCFGHVLGMVDKQGLTWAVKEIRHEGHAPPLEVRAMLMRLAFNMALHEAYYTMNSTYMVMPALPHGSLAELAERHVELTPTKLRSISAQVAFGLWELHQRGLIHRDLQPRNVMLVDQVGDNITIIDYSLVIGGCKDEGGKNCSSEAIGPGKAWAATVGRPHSYEVDWWSFGVLLYNLTFGRYPLEPLHDGYEGPPRYFDTSALQGEDPSLASILNATIGAGYLSLGKPEARVAMESPFPEAHPILGSDFWLRGVNFTPATRAEALRDYWSGICRSHAADPATQCSQLFKEKATDKLWGSCDRTIAAKCCCRQSNCRRDGAGNISEGGVDSLSAVQRRESPMCCARSFECGVDFPDEWLEDAWKCNALGVTK